MIILNTMKNLTNQNNDQTEHNEEPDQSKYPNIMKNLTNENNDQTEQNEEPDY